MEQERPETLWNFLIPALVISIGILLLSIGANSLFLILVLLDSFTPLIIDAKLMTILANLAGQILGTIIVLVILIPLLRIQKVEFKSLTIGRFWKTLLAFCLAFTTITFIALAIFFGLTSLGIPIGHSYESIVPSLEHLANPAITLVFFVTFAVGAPVFEELLFRRMIIPLLEARGMAPLLAAITSSLGFAFIHLPNDFLNGTPGFALTHFISVFTNGLFLGIVYITTRNVIFPILIHGLNNFVSLIDIILVEILPFPVAIIPIIIFSFIILAIWIIGIITGIYALVQYFKESPPPWVQTLRLRTKISTLPGLIGYSFTVLALFGFSLIIELIIAVTLFSNIIIAFIGIIVFNVWLLIILILYVKKATAVDIPPSNDLLE